jgi:hypothetical protein
MCQYKYVTNKKVNNLYKIAFVAQVLAIWLATLNHVARQNLARTVSHMARQPIEIHVYVNVWQTKHYKAAANMCL